MDVRGRAIALYGRFSHGERERLAARIEAAGGEVARDLTRRSDLLVVGALATPLIDSGALSDRLSAARGRGVPILGERAFAAALAGETPDAPPATLPAATAVAGTGLSLADLAVLAAFDLIGLEEDRTRFGDAQVVRTAAELAAGASLGEAVRILAQARDHAPRGRRRVVLTATGEAALQWDDGRSTLKGQGVLPLEDDLPTLDDLFEAAALAEAEDELDVAARLYDQCARADRKDAIAPYNHGNIRLAQGAHDAAALAYRRALGRDPKFAEARYNLAQALEAAGKPEAAADELAQLVASDPTYADAVFNLAQLRLRAGAMPAAKALFERYLTLDPPPEWASTARRGVLYCDAHMAS